MEIIQQPVLDASYNSMVVTRQNGKKELRIKSDYSINVNADKEYKMEIIISGEGDFCIGWSEYGAELNQIKEVLSQKFTLTPNAKTYILSGK
ncbi:MAG: hypothetical protein JW957_03445, partial [Candidatus Omnitrophica bacterium]|nr:hypothetical protein [Candidatus Omnitrophota bacterium]